MNIENYTAYIESGINLTSNSRNGIISIVSTGLLSLLGVLMGFLMGGVGKNIAILMVVFFLLTNILYFIVYFMGHSVKNLLIEQLLIYIGWLIQFALIQTLAYYETFGWQWKILLFYLPLPVPSLIFGFIHSYMLKKDKPFSSGKIAFGKLLIIGAQAGFFGRYLAKVFMTDINPETGTLIVLTMFSATNLLMSLGLLNIQKLYYYSKVKKYENTGDDSVCHGT